MAQATTLTEIVDAALEYFSGLLTDLEEFSAEWEGLDEVEQVAFRLDWGQGMGSRLRTLDQQSRSGLMTLGQQRRYAQLLHKLQAQLPTIQVLDLQLPSVPLPE